MSLSRESESQDLFEFELSIVKNLISQLTKSKQSQTFVIDGIEIDLFDSEISILKTVQNNLDNHSSIDRDHIRCLVLCVFNDMVLSKNVEVLKQQFGKYTHHYVNDQSNNNWPSLHKLLCNEQKKCYEMAKYLIESGADVLKKIQGILPIKRLGLQHGFNHYEQLFNLLIDFNYDQTDLKKYLNDKSNEYEFTSIPSTLSKLINKIQDIPFLAQKLFEMANNNIAKMNCEELLIVIAKRLQPHVEPQVFKQHLNILLQNAVVSSYRSNTQTLLALGAFRKRGENFSTATQSIAWLVNPPQAYPYQSFVLLNHDLYTKLKSSGLLDQVQPEHGAYLIVEPGSTDPDHYILKIYNDEKRKTEIKLHKGNLPKIDFDKHFIQPFCIVHALYYKYAGDYSYSQNDILNASKHYQITKNSESRYYESCSATMKFIAGFDEISSKTDMLAKINNLPENERFPLLKKLLESKEKFEEVHFVASEIAKSLSATSSCSSYANQYQQLGDAYFNSEKYSFALDMYHIAFKFGSTEIYFNRARTYYSLKKYDEAIQDYTSAIALKPNEAQYYFCRGLAFDDQASSDLFFTTEKKGKAIADYLFALNLDKDNTFGLNSVISSNDHEEIFSAIISISDTKKKCDLLKSCADDKTVLGIHFSSNPEVLQKICKELSKFILPHHQHLFLFPPQAQLRIRGLKLTEKVATEMEEEAQANQNKTENDKEKQNAALWHYKF